MVLEDKRILILGGDLRIVYLANMLSKHSKVYSYGLKHHMLSDDVKPVCDLSEHYHVVIGPIPLSRDGVTINAPTWEETLNVKVLETICADYIIGCKIPSTLEEVWLSRNSQVEDILEREDFAIANALPTAEGAIQLAMEETPYILTGTPSLVLGFGRCGKILASKLKDFGAEVAVEARKVHDLEYIQSYGMKAVPLRDLENVIKDYKVIYNTIPRMILTEKLIKQLPKDALIIDLASKPGGTDFIAAEKRGIKAINALGLPGKCAPETAAKIILNCIYKILD